jgi:hypothetical protein
LWSVLQRQAGARNAPLRDAASSSRHYEARSDAAKSMQRFHFLKRCGNGKVVWIAACLARPLLAASKARNHFHLPPFSKRLIFQSLLKYTTLQEQT